MINYLYKIFRFILFPLIFLANFLQNRLTSLFTPMNMGPVSKKDYSLHIKKLEFGIIQYYLLGKTFCL